MKTLSTKKLLAVLLAVAMLLTILEVPVSAETAGQATQGVSPENPVHHCTKSNDGTDTTDWSYVYFGSYPQTEITGTALTAAITEASYDSNGDAVVEGIKYRRISKSDTNYDKNFGDSEYRYFKWESIRWRVLQNDGTTLFVMADKGLDCKAYNDPGGSITWENCTLRDWLNNDFYDVAFSSQEQKAIVEQALENRKNPDYETEAGNDTRDHIFLLSVEDAANPKYGFCEGYGTYSLSRQVQASEYAHIMGATTVGNTNCWWWQRSPGSQPYYAVSVYNNGKLAVGGSFVYNNNYSCVPALHINLSSDCWFLTDDGSGNTNQSDLKNTWLSNDQYYYKQLSAEHKEAWDFVITNVLNYPNQDNKLTENNRKYQALSRMIAADNPRIFWMNEIYRGAIYHDTGGTLTYRLPQINDNGIMRSLTTDEFQAFQRQFLKSVSDDVKEIKQLLPEKPSTYEIVVAIHNWLCKNNTYNDDQTSSHKRDNDPMSFAYLAAHHAYSAIVKGDEYEPVCEGYASAFKLLCEEFGIECICVSGSTSGISAHMWNYVKMDDGQWYLVDLTGDDNNDPEICKFTLSLAGKTINDIQLYRPNPYMGSGITDANGVSFVFPELADGIYYYVDAPVIAWTDEYGGKQVTISGKNLSISTVNMYLYYTLDGSDPTTSSQYKYEYIPAYQGEVTLSQWLAGTTYLKTMLQVGGNTWSYKSFSRIASEEIVVEQAAQPVISADNTTVTLTPSTSATSKVRIYYTTDGTDPSYIGGSNPSVTGKLYNGSFQASKGQVIKAIAVDKGFAVSEISSYTMGHIHSTSWSKDDNYHWRPCTEASCNEKLDFAVHIWDSGKVTTAPTYEEAGVKTYNCTVCGRTKKESIPKLTHSYSTEWSRDATYHWHACTDAGYEGLMQGKAVHTWDNGKVTAEPDYESEGEKTYSCTVCGQTRIEAIEKLEHHFASEWSKDETYHWHACTDSGCTEISEKAAHIWGTGKVTTAPTYEEAGVKTYNCTVCGQTKTESIPKLTHSYSTEWSRDETYHWHACTDAGYEGLIQGKAVHTWDNGKVTAEPGYESEGEKTYSCTVCGQTRTETIERLEHHFSVEWSKDAVNHWHACTDSGCTEISEKAAHIWGIGKITTAPTYEEAGVKTYNCTVCGQTRTETIEKLEHHFSVEWSKDGMYHWHACTDSGCTETSEKAVHIWETGKVTTAPTYEEAGVKTYNCTVCGQTKKESIPKLTHSYSTEWSRDETYHWHACTDAGYEGLIQGKAVHTWDNGKVTTEPDYESEGEKTYSCIVCGQTRTETIEKLEHHFSVEWSKDAVNHWHACTDSGCTEISDKTAHIWGTGKVTTAPTYEEAGVKTYNCTVCGQTRTEAIEKLEHHFAVEWSKDETYHWHACTDSGCTETSEKAAHIWGIGIVTTAPTYEEAGVKTYNCTVCGRTKMESIPKLSHSYSTEWNKDETYHWHVCTDAGYEELIQGKTGHTWDNGKVTTEPGYGFEGEKTYSCMVCGQTRTETIEKLEHHFAVEWSKDETYHWHACTDEGYEDLTQRKAGHTWNTGEVTIEATYEREGVKTYMCTVCHWTKTESIPKRVITPDTNQPTTPDINANTDINTNAKTSLEKAVIILSANTCNYDGKAKEPIVKSVELNGKTLKSGTDYTVSYVNNKNIGTATVTITGKGNYIGIAKQTFTITVKKGSIFTVGANKYKITDSSTVAFKGLKSSKKKKVTIPKMVKIGGKNFKVTAVEAKALQNKNKITSVTIGANITSVGKNVFAKCKKLKVIVIKSTKLKAVGKNTFKGIKATAKIKVPVKKLSAYKKLLKGKGQGKKVKITK